MAALLVQSGEALIHSPCEHTIANIHPSNKNLHLVMLTTHKQPHTHLFHFLFRASLISDFVSTRYCFFPTISHYFLSFSFVHLLNCTLSPFQSNALVFIANLHSFQAIHAIHARCQSTAPPEIPNPSQQITYSTEKYIFLLFYNTASLLYIHQQ